MKNLKKVLALVLAFACAFTMFAGAAFTDQADIAVDSEVVDTLVALGVIQGYEDGSFQPETTVTRAEMAKMIYVLRTGNSDASAYNDDATSFTDISYHWARGYIKYCQSLGIIAGKSATIFDPDNTVTTQEAAKMLLVTLGYDADRAGLVGAGWGNKTNALADENGLLEDVNNGTTQGLQRQYAAQMMYNAIDAPTVVWRDDAYTNTNVLGEDNQTVGEKYMSLKKTTSTLLNVTKTSGKDTFELELDSDSDVVDWENTTETENSNKAIFKFTDVENDYSNLKYQTVTVLHKSKDEVYGVFATDDNTEQTGILADIKMDGNKVKLDGTKYDLASTTKVYVNGDLVTDESIDTIKEFVDKYGDDSSTKYTDPKYFQATEVQLLATDGSSNYSILNVTTYMVGQVTAVGSDYVNVSYKEGDRSIATSTKLEEDDWDWYDGIAKDDYVILTDAGNYATGEGLIEKAEVVTGKVDGTRSDDGVSVDDEWYTMAGKGDAMVKRPNTGANVDMVVVNGYVYYTDTTAGSIDDVALLVEAAPSGGVNSKWEARLIFADGSDKVVEIEKKWDDKDDGVQIQEFHEGNGENPNTSNISNGAFTSKGDSDTKADPMLVSYEVSKDVYTLTRLGYANTDTDDNEIDTNGYDTYISVEGGNTDGSIKNGTFKSTDGATVSRLYYESTGVVIVKYNADENGEDADYKVVTGKTASDYDRVLQGAVAVADKSGNSYYAQAAFIDLGELSTGGSSDNYAVVTANVEKRTGTENGTVYVIHAWNGTEPITVTTDDSAANSLSKGDVFSYTGTGDTLADIETYSNQGDYYVGSYDEGSGDITLYETYTVGNDTKFRAVNTNLDAWTVIDDSNTTVLFVDSDNDEGVTGYDLGDIDLAYVFDADFWSNGRLPAIGDIEVSGTEATANGATLTEDCVPNVHVFVDNDGDDQITVIVVDINNNITQW